ncbi:MULTISPECIES: LysE family translocator [unclassified Pseudomonas]|uniref:LysE family translocator n=1 Tax=unclassified Pseudomonas TaxID=196821 RepID=UPI0025F76D1A|nr:MULTISPECIES: LysE family transporter [unclassified Pseudomonas]
MEYVQSLAVLISVYMISLISPGPNFIVVTRTSMAVSRKAGLFAGLGLACASLSWAILAMAGVALLIAHFQWLQRALEWAGAAYLIWLGIKMIAGAKQPLRLTGTAEPTWQGAMRRAYVVSMTSPKSLAFFGGVFAVVIPAHAPLWFLLVVGGLCFVLSALWYCGVALCFSNRRIASGFLRFKAPIERGMGSVLIVLGGLKAG